LQKLEVVETGPQAPSAADRLAAIVEGDAEGRGLRTASLARQAPRPEDGRRPSGQGRTRSCSWLDVPDLYADLGPEEGRAEIRQVNKRGREAWEVAIKEVDETRKESKKFEADVELSRLRLSRIAKLVRGSRPDVSVEMRRRGRWTRRGGR